jgi:hypothetical protein
MPGSQITKKADPRVGSFPYGSLIRQPALRQQPAAGAAAAAASVGAFRFLDGETHTALTVHFQYLHLHHVTDFQEVGHVLRGHR